MAKYTSVSISGYNATPPSDDGTVSESNKVKWSTEKTKLTDPIKTALESINTNLVSAFDVGPTALVSNTTLGASHYGDFIQVSGVGVTLTLTDAATLTAGWHCEVINTDSTNTITIGRATGGDTINGTAANISLLPYQAIKILVNAAANGFIITARRTHSKAERLEGSVWMAEGAAVASATTTDIWTSDGNTVHITGTTTITSLGTAPQAGAVKWIIFDDVLTLTHGANLNLPGSANITTASGDFARVYADTTTQFDIQYFKANGTSIVDSKPGSQLFTSNGTFTVPTGITSVLLTGVSGGGGGGGADTGTGGGGGGSGTALMGYRVSVTPGDAISVTIGSAGTAGLGQNPGGNGGDTIFGALLTLVGGTGGQAGQSGGAGGAGGTAITVSVIRYNNSNGVGGSNCNLGTGGAGASSFYGTGGAATAGGTGYGAGGGGGNAINGAGGAGTAGFLIVEW